MKSKLYKKNERELMSININNSLKFYANWLIFFGLMSKGQRYTIIRPVNLFLCWAATPLFNVGEGWALTNMFNTTTFCKSNLSHAHKLNGLMQTYQMLCLIIFCQGVTYFSLLAVCTSYLNKITPQKLALILYCLDEFIKDHLTKHNCQTKI